MLKMHCVEKWVFVIVFFVFLLIVGYNLSLNLDQRLVYENILFISNKRKLSSNYKMGIETFKPKIRNKLNDTHISFL